MSKNHLKNISLLILMLIILFSSSSCQTKQIDNNPTFISNYVEENGTLIVAHRGYAAIAPENTISAFEEAKKAGAKACEFDVQISEDDVLVVIHDNTVDRTTNGSGKVKQLSYEYLSTLDAGSWKDEKYTGEKIPTLKETLTYLKQNNMIAVLEIKASNIEEDVINLIYETEMQEKTIIIGFSKSTISNTLKLDSSIPSLLLIKKNSCMTGSSLDKVKGIESELKRVKTKYIGPYSFQLEKLDTASSSLAKSLMKKSKDPGTLPLALDKETITLLHDKGYFINVWTVDNEENMRDLISNNIDILTTNYLEKAISIKDELNNK
ncbi:MAG: glycerophosphodiester phosphodiesterase [Pleomorphochaeta sp.]